MKDPRSIDALLRSCIHCGLCLGSCPTYVVTGDEAESPRGRLLLLRDLLGGEEGGLLLAELDRAPLDRCLDCRSCESMCPSGVPYGELLAEGRRRLGPAGTGGALVAWLSDQVLARPRRLAALAWLGGLFLREPLLRLLPGGWRLAALALPARPARWPRRPDLGPRGDVALLAGCAQRVYSPEVLGATARLVEAVGGRPYLPPGQACCGALSHHAGSAEQARELARRNVDAFEDAPEIVVPSAGCSAHMREYGALLAEDPRYARRAAAVAERVVDLVVWLDRRREALRLRPDPRRVSYHPPCHHTHAQGIRTEPLRLLERVPELTVVPLAHAERCCGSAGSYGLLQPVLSSALREEKLTAVEEAGPELLLTANPGCELHLDRGLRERGGGPPVEHLASYLARRLL